MLVESLAQYILSAVLSGAAMLIAFSIKSMLGELRAMAKNVAELNAKIAVIIERQDWHHRDIERITKRLEAIEYGTRDH